MKVVKLYYLFVGFLLLAPLFSCGSYAPHKTNAQFSQYSGDDESGIGGTGILANKSGIGGTGIIGEITGFGSIFVNGVEVEVDAETRLYVDGKKIAKHHFARGEVVALRAEQGGKLDIAREIYIRHEVIGQVEHVSAQTKHFVVLGQRIDGRSLSLLPRRGTFIRVSGFRDHNGTIHARHLSISNNHKQNMLLGKIRRHNNQWYIGQQQLELPVTSRVQAGEMLRIHGALNKQQVLQVKNIQRINRLPFSKPVKTILIQGQIKKSGVQQYTISGYRLNVGGLRKQLLQKLDSIVLLQRTDFSSAWQLKRSLNRQQLPLGSPRPVMLHNRPSQPVRPMTPQVPYSMPNRFFR